ncbi:16S rRNA (uracil(1498)-N(3))-methyltransferase [Lutibaculum baratangense]|uniref:Ribosomal RNA small subunit methyltransferase E n=1 Tax=Lutibaculum baratangense AMV1 TaxID=631454 RepID=V4TFN8_9HYPH|nr:16S rRNA (uracil(1498)-N(3))-methyltransferase [Lutibaculum baratangense]ESR24948.1 Ribosomal RNA small subunit methyltransferase E [Lutibaculum baratangense AMV1]
MKPQRADRAPRVYVEAPLADGASVAFAPDTVHYLANVLRRVEGDPVILFNGRDGEWRAELANLRKKAAEARLVEQLRPQAPAPDLHYCFAPIKRARVDYIAQKATELGAARLVPVITHHTNAERVKTERLRANAVEAAEQCGICWAPEVEEPVSLSMFLKGREAGRLLVFCDEAAPVADPIAALRGAPAGPIAVLVGPEGGFSGEERALLLRQENVLPISLGPRVMRADTAGVAALALVQAVLGDWRNGAAGGT